MKKTTSLIIGAVLAAVAVCFVAYATVHPESSFPWSNRITFMIYGAYIWLLLKFLIDIPFSRKEKERTRPRQFDFRSGLFLHGSCILPDGSNGRHSKSVYYYQRIHCNLRSRFWN